MKTANKRALNIYVQDLTANSINVTHKQLNEQETTYTPFTKTTKTYEIHSSSHSLHNRNTKS